MGRKQNDVFVLGDETLVAEPNSTEDANLVGDDDATREFGAESAELYEPVTPAIPRSRVAPAPRRLAVLGLSAGAATVVAVSMLSSGGGEKTPTSPPRSTSLVSSPPSLPAAKPNVTAPSPRPHRHVHHRVRRTAKPKRDVRNHHHRDESQRETTPIEAPVDSTVSIPVTSTAPVEPSPAPVTTPEPPSPPPPPQSGGGSGARAEFSFER